MSRGAGAVGRLAGAHSPGITPSDRTGNFLAVPRHEDFIVYDRRARLGLLPAILAACGQAGFAPRIRHDASATELMLGLVAAGDGVALVSSTAARAPHRGVRFASLAGRPASSPILLAWRTSMPDGVVTELVDLLRSTALRRQ